MSDDGRHGLTLIAFIGSVFSPYYAWSGWKDPLDHCALNVALYGAGGGRWSMTERRRGALRREADELSIGPSSLTWDGDALTARFDEVTAPLPSRIRGAVRILPQALVSQSFALDAAGRHVWRPIAPRARVEVSLTQPDCRWSGNAYFDTNTGDEPLESRFSSWDWARAQTRDDTLIFYDVERSAGDSAGVALSINRRGDVQAIQPPPRKRLPPTFWRMPRTLRSEALDPPRLRQTLEDTPFYSRSLVDGRYGGRPAQIVHESLSLDRLRSPVVRAMLPFRMPRTLW
jgi:carotenoid 1,2-hydratase